MMATSHIDHIGKEYFMAEVKMKDMENSIHNPREMKISHKNELKKSMEAEGQMVPIIGHLSRQEYDNSELGSDGVLILQDGTKVEILNGGHRYVGALELGFLTLNSKIYLGLNEEQQMKMAADLNESQKPLNAGEKQRSHRDQMEVVANRLVDEGRRVINEEAILHEHGVFRDGKRKAYIKGKITSELRDNSSHSDYISDAQTPASQIKNGTKLSIFTAGNIEKFLESLCHCNPIGPWKPHESAMSLEDYERKLAEKANTPGDSGVSMNDLLALREEERKNVEMLFSIVMEEAVLPLMQNNQYEKAMTMCRYHVIQAVSTVIKEILLNNGSNMPSAPLFVKHDQIAWSEVKTYVRKLRNIRWHDPLYTQIRVPDIIADMLWREVFP